MSNATIYSLPGVIVSSDFDEGSFTKVRGWLLAFSSTIIALWFFGVDLKSVSILGTKIDFTRNTEYVWLVAFAVSAYLLLRFYQHQPYISYSEWGEYKKCYESVMVKLSRLISRRSIANGVFEKGGVYSFSDLKGRKVKCVVDSTEFNLYTNRSEKRRYIRGMRQVVIFHARCLISDKDGGNAETTKDHAVELDYPYSLICVCVWLSKLKIWVTTSYATEHVLPYVWSGSAAVVCLIRWQATLVS